MSLIPCKKCGQEISRGVQRCPKCGTTQGNKPLIFRPEFFGLVGVGLLWTLVNLMFTLLGLIFLFGGGERTGGVGFFMLMFPACQIAIIRMQVRASSLTITPTESICVTGIFNRKEIRIRHADVRAVVISEPFGQRLFGCADIQIGSAGSGDMEIIFIGVFRADADAVRRAVESYRNKQ